MKVLQLISNPGIGGTETFLLNLVPGLMEKGIDVRLLNLWSGGGDIRPVAEELSLPYTVIDAGSRRIRMRGLMELNRYIGRERFDIINTYGLRTSLITRLLPAVCGEAVLITGLRGIDTWRRWYHVLPDWLTSWRVDYFVGNSQQVCAVRRRRERTPESKLVCIPNGIDITKFEPEAIPSPSRESLGLPPHVLCTTVANFRAHKGHAYLLEVIERAFQSQLSIHFAWVGAGDDEKTLKHQVNRRGLQSMVTFLGAMEDVRPVLNMSDIFFLPSREEGMPRALMEAMAMGVAPIATRVGGVPEVIDDGVSGLLVDYQDVEAGVDALAQIVDSRETRELFGQASRRAIVERFSLQAMVDRYEAFYRSVVESQ